MTPRRWLALIVSLIVWALLTIAMRVWAASDFMYGGINCGQTSRSLSVVFRLTSDNTEATGVLASQVTANYWRQGGLATAITTTTIANVNGPYASGGFTEVDSTNMPGLYRFDIPDAAIACGADWVNFNIKRRANYGAAVYVYHERLGLASAPDVNVLRWNQFAVTSTPVDANTRQWRGTDVISTAVTANTTKWNGTDVISTAVTANTTQWNGTNVTSTPVDANTRQWRGVDVVATTVDANTTKLSGTTQTARDIGSSVLLSNGTGAGQVSLSSGRVAIQATVKKNTALATATPFLMTDSTNHAPATGLTVSCTRSLDGAAFAAGTLGSVAEVSDGFYTIASFAAGDLNAGQVVVKCSATGADDTFFTLVTYP